MGACWSGGLDATPGHEPLGLPTVALVRGARAAMASLHPLPDASTGHILAELYSYLARGVPAPAALRAAQQEYLREHGPTCPLVDWASLVSIGASS